MKKTIMNISRTFLTLISVLLISGYAYSLDHFTESFSGGPTDYYTGDHTFSSGLTWELAEIKGESAANSVGGIGGASRFLISTTSFIVSPSVNTVGTISFQYRELNAVGGGTFKVQKSVGGGAFTDIATQNFSGTGFQTFSIAINDASNDIRIKVVGINNTTYLIIDELTLTSLSSDPTLVVSPSTLTGFNYVAGSGPSVEQSYTLSGTNLTGSPSDITVTAPANYEVSLSSGSGFASSILVPYGSATLGSTTIYVRLIAGLSIGSYNSEVITNFGGGVISSTDVTCSGSVTAVPSATLNVSPSSLSGFTYTVGAGPSTEQSFSVSGTNLTGSDVTITPSTNYEISLSSGTGFQSTAITLTAFNGTATTVYVRLVTGLAIGTYDSELITVSGGGATDIDVTCNGNVTDVSSSPCLSEDFTGFSAGTHASTSSIDISASLDSYTATTGWTGYKIYQAGGEVKLGTGSLNGYLITPTIDLSAGGSISFDYAKYSTDASVVQVFHAADGVTFVQVGANITPATEFATFSIDITDGTALSKIKIGTDIKRAYLDNIQVFCGTSTDPVFSVTNSTLSGFTYIEGSGPSTEQSFDLSGANLDGSDVTITPSTNYEISFTSGAGFQSTALTLTAFDGTATTVYIRLKSALSPATYNSELITVSGGGSTDITVTCNGVVNSLLNPELIATPSTLNGFNYTEGSGPSAEQSFSVTGTDMDGSDVTITPSINYEISLTSGAGFQSTALTLTAYDGTATTVYVRLISGLVIGNYNSEILTISGGSASDITVTCNGTVNAIPVPTLTAVPTTLSGLNYFVGSGPSAEQTFTLSGTILNGGDVIITPSTNYEISLISGGPFQSTPITITAFDGTANDVYVRLIAGLAIADYNTEIITISGGGATDITVECNGSVLDPASAPCLAEYFDNFTDGTHASPSFSDIATSLDTYTAIPGWTGYKIYSAGGEIKIGVSGDNGYIVTPTIDLTAGGSLSFDYAKWGTDVSVVQVFHAADGVTFVQIGANITPETNFQTASIDITDGTALSKIKIGTNVKRAFLDNIEITCGTSTDPILTVDPTTLNGFTYIEGFGPSTEQSFTVSGANLDGSDVTITPSTNYEISFTSGAGFQSTALTLSSFDGTTTTVYVRLITGLPIGNYDSEIITVSGGTAADVTVTCNGSVIAMPGATLIANPLSLVNLNYVLGTGPSGGQPFVLSGINLDGSEVTIAASANFEISLSLASGYSLSPIILPAYSGVSTTIYVRLKEFLPAGAYNAETVIISGGGADDIWVTCSGTVEEIVAPTLTADPTELSGFNYLYEAGPSPQQWFTLSGVSLNATDVIITPTANYEISLTSGAGFQNAPITLTAFDGTATPIYVRLIAVLAIGEYNLNDITITGGGATDIMVSCNGTVTDGSSFPCLMEDFSGFTAGTHASPSTTDWATELDSHTMYPGWTGLKVYSAGGEIKIGTSSANGYIITPTIDLSEGASLNFDYAKWGTDVSVIQIFHASDGVNFVQVGVDITPATEFQSYSLQINDGTELSKIKIATDVKRAYLDNIEVFCGAYSPEAVLATDPTSLSDFYYIWNEGPSTQQSFNLSGNFMDGSDVTISPSTNYEVSMTSGTGFQSSDIVLLAFDGTATTVYVRLKAGLDIGDYNSEMISITGGGAAAGAGVVCNGFVDIGENVEFANNDDNLMIFPNPVNDVLNIRLSETNSNEITWNIVSITGQVVMSGTMDSNNSVIDISNFKSGMYILNLRDDQNNYFRKFNKK